MPVPVPSVVFVVRAIVGFGVVPQTIPLAVTADPPSTVIVPPLVAEVVEIDVTVAIDQTVGVDIVVNVTSGP